MNRRQRVIAEAKEVICPGMPGPDHLLRYDNLDDRRQMARALTALGAAGRLTFVRWCCRYVDKSIRPRVAPQFHKDGLALYTVTEALSDMGMLTIQYRVSARLMLQELDRRARRV